MESNSILKYSNTSKKSNKQDKNPNNNSPTLDFMSNNLLAISKIKNYVPHSQDYWIDYLKKKSKFEKKSSQLF